MRPPRGAGGAALLFALALAPRLLFFWEWNHAGLLNLPVVDAATYDAEARGLLAGTWPGPLPFWQAPLYSFVLAGIYKLFGWHWEVARLAQALLGAGSCLLVHQLARPLGRTAAWIAFGVVALYGPLLYFEGQLLRETLGIFLLLAWLLAERQAAGRAWSSAASGLLLGATACCRENALVLAPIAIGFVAWNARVGARRRLVAAWCAGFLLALLPVTLHNVRTARGLVPISTSGGINLYLANNDDAIHTLAIRPGRHWKALTARPWREAGRLAPEDQARFWTREAVVWMWRHPHRFGAGLLRKGLDLIAGREVRRNQDLYAARPGSMLLSALLWKVGPFGFPFGVVGPIGIVGLVLFLRDPRRARDLDLAAWAVIVYAAGVVLFFPSARHRVPLVPPLALFAGYAIQELRSARLRRTALLGVSACALLALPGGADPSGDPAEPYFLRGTALAALGRDAEAETELRGAVRLNPRHEEAWADLAVLAGRNGRLEASLEAAERAISLDSTFADAWVDLGAARAAGGAPAAAAAAYARALALEPDCAAAAVGLARVKLLERDAKAALTVLEDGARQAPRDAELARLEAEVAQGLHDPARVASALERLVRIEPRDADAWNNLGITRAQLGKPEEARRAFERALRIDPRHASARANLRLLTAN